MHVTRIYLSLMADMLQKIFLHKFQLKHLKLTLRVLLFHKLFLFLQKNCRLCFMMYGHPCFKGFNFYCIKSYHYPNQIQRFLSFQKMYYFSTCFQFKVPKICLYFDVVVMSFYIQAHQIFCLFIFAAVILFPNKSSYGKTSCQSMVIK